VPRSKDGLEELSNYSLACRACDQAHPPREAAALNWFRIHDWRHHWTAWFIMDGGDAPSLMALGGWKNPKMIQRYMTLSVEHLGRQVNQTQARGA
jgi:integrase